MLGHTVDTVLYNQLKQFINLINPKRQRSRLEYVKGATESGKAHKILNGFKGANTLEIEYPNGLIVKLTAKTKEEADQLIRAKTKEWLADHPTGTVKGGEFVKRYLEEKIYIANQLDGSRSLFEGNVLLQAVLKIVINYYIYKGGSPEYLRPVVRLVKGELGIRFDNHIKYYYTSLPFHNLLENELSHIIYIEGDTEGNLFAYVELLSFLNFFVVIDTQYTGPVFKYQYCYDLVEEQEIDKLITIEKQKSFFLDFPRLRMPDKKFVGQALYNRFMTVAERNQNIFNKR